MAGEIQVRQWAMVRRWRGGHGSSLEGRLVMEWAGINRLAGLAAPSSLRFLLFDVMA
jgi:hypothetical protein